MDVEMPLNRNLYDNIKEASKAVLQGDYDLRKHLEKGGIYIDPRVGCGFYGGGKNSSDLWAGIGIKVKKPNQPPKI